MLRGAAPWLAVSAVALAVVITGAWIAGQKGASFSPSRHVSVSGLDVDIPAHWHVHDRLPRSMGVGQLLAVVGTQPWGPCGERDVTCHYEQRLATGEISVQFGMVALLGDGVCEIGASRSDLARTGPNDPAGSGLLMRVDARPTLQTRYGVGRQDYYRADEWRRWLIAAPGTTRRAYTIDAKYQGADIATFTSQLDAMVASIRLSGDVPGNDGPADCGPPFPP